MNVSKKEFIEQHKESRPAVSSFAECISRGYLTGVASFALGCSAVHIIQSQLKDRLPYPYKIQLILSLCVGVGISYKVGIDKIRLCQAAFMAEEGKTTYFTRPETNDSEV